MMNILSSNAATPSKGLRKVTRDPGEDNISWLERNLSTGDGSAIVLLGGTSPTAFRLRVAQAHVRHDLYPSSWSHAVLLDRRAKKLASTRLWEISLEPPKGYSFPPPTNAVQTATLSAYADAQRFPNIAVLHVPVRHEEVQDALKRFQMQRAVLDTVDLLVRWLAFAWGVSSAGNPLLSNHGIPSAAMLDVVFGAAGFDLTPGLESRASCPEAIWQAAKWWHEYYEKQNISRLDGAYVTTHELLAD
ncbi:MAG: hypothetical protein KFF77_07065 [Bacteroidetes bacterium]|nr:hypothetical protein [Bacteroidota bacterium]